MEENFVITVAGKTYDVYKKTQEDGSFTAVLSLPGLPRFNVYVCFERRYGSPTYTPHVNWSAYGDTFPEAAENYGQLLAASVQWLREQGIPL